MSDLVGTTLDRYELVSILGEGGFGTVFRARHVVLDQWFAVKVLHATHANEMSIKRFLREAKTVAALGSPHIVRVTDGGVSDELVYFIAMELLEGRPLDAIIEAEGTLEVPRVLRIAKHILEGLRIAHDSGVVHRDLKPANVFITTDDDGEELAKILDFGISKIVDPTLEDITREGTLLGTPRYMAPEQLFSSAVDARADLYSTACLLYHALSGALPFEADSIARLASEITTGRPTPIRERTADLPEELAYVVDRGLAKDPDGRWQSASEMLEALEAVERGEEAPKSAPTAETTAPSRPEPVHPSEPTRRWWPLALAVVLGGALAFGITAWSSGESEETTREPMPPTESPTPAPPIVANEAPPEEPTVMEAEPTMSEPTMHTMTAMEAMHATDMRATEMHATEMRATEMHATEMQQVPVSRELPRYVLQRFKTCPFPSWQGRFTVDVQVSDGRVTSARARGAPNEVTQCLRLALDGGRADVGGSVDVEVDTIRGCAIGGDGFRACGSW